MAAPSSEMLHASTVAIQGRAVLIEGRSGSGKSDLALRLIDRGAALVSDDYTLVKHKGDGLAAYAAPNIAGKIEIRGLGIIEMPHVDEQPVHLVVTLAEQIIRMPAEETHRTIAGRHVPSVTLDAREASAPLKVEFALRRVMA